MNLRIQTYGIDFLTSLVSGGVLTCSLDSTTAVEALEKGLDSLMDLCDVVTDKFTTARDAFNANEADRMTS